VRGGGFTIVDEVTIEKNLIASGLMQVIESLKLRPPSGIK
jgi:hypothetical protein